MYFKEFPSFIVYQSGLSSRGVEKHYKHFSPASSNPTGKNFFRKMLLWWRLSGRVGVLKFHMMFCIFLLNEQEKTHLALIWILNRFGEEIPSKAVFLHLKSTWEWCSLLISNQQQPEEAELGQWLHLLHNSNGLSRGAGYIKQPSTGHIRT